MNHDACHCLDYNEKTCPKNCYRAKLTKELRESSYPYPTSWSNFEGTRICPKPLLEEDEAPKEVK